MSNEFRRQPERLVDHIISSVVIICIIALGVIILCPRVILTKSDAKASPMVDVAVDGPSVIVWQQAGFELMPNMVPSYDWSKAITRGSRTFLPLVLPGMPVRQAELILDTLKAFEDAHPEWEITTWRTDAHMYLVGTASRVEGLWVDHRPKASPGPEKK